MAIGKFHGAIRPTTPIGWRKISTPTPGRTEGKTSPPMRSASPAKNLKIIAARTVSPMPSGSVLPSSRDNIRPISSLRARISLPTASSTSKRSCGVAAAQPGNAARAAAIADSACASSACAYKPITSDVSEGLMLGSVVAPATHSPLMKLSKVFMGSASRFTCPSARPSGRAAWRLQSGQHVCPGASPGTDGAALRTRSHRPLSSRPSRPTARPADFRS